MTPTPWIMLISSSLFGEYVCFLIEVTPKLFMIYSSLKPENLLDPRKFSYTFWPDRSLSTAGDCTLTYYM